MITPLPQRKEHTAGQDQNLERFGEMFLLVPVLFSAPLSLTSPRGVLFSVSFGVAPRGVHIKVQGIRSGNIVVAAVDVIFWTKTFSVNFN